MRALLVLIFVLVGCQQGDSGGGSGSSNACNPPSIFSVWEATSSAYEGSFILDFREANYDELQVVSDSDGNCLFLVEVAKDAVEIDGAFYNIATAECGSGEVTDIGYYTRECNGITIKWYDETLEYLKEI